MSSGRYSPWGDQPSAADPEEATVTLASGLRLSAADPNKARRARLHRALSLVTLAAKLCGRDPLDVLEELAIEAGNAVMRVPQRNGRATGEESARTPASETKSDPS